MVYEGHLASFVSGLSAINDSSGENNPWNRMFYTATPSSTSRTVPASLASSNGFWTNLSMPSASRSGAFSGGFQEAQHLRLIVGDKNLLGAAGRPWDQLY